MVLTFLLHRTTPDETKEAYGRPRADHDALDTGKGQASLRDRVDAAVSETSNVPAGRKAEDRTEQGFTVGERADHHDLAARKQP